MGEVLLLREHRSARDLLRTSPHLPYDGGAGSRAGGGLQEQESRWCTPLLYSPATKNPAHNICSDSVAFFEYIEKYHCSMTTCPCVPMPKTFLLTSLSPSSSCTRATSSSSCLRRGDSFGCCQISTASPPATAKKSLFVVS